MKKTFLLFVLASACFITKAQNLIAVEHSGVSAFYSTLDSAVNAAQTGDNVYVPGGNFTLSVPISKGFNLIGVGYNPDSTIATGFTQIAPLNGNGDVYIITGADNGSITGIYFYNTNISFGYSSSNQTVNNFTISRCRILGLYLGYSIPTISTNLVFSENVIDGYSIGDGIKNCFFNKNIFSSQGDLENFQNGNEFVNNIFLAQNGTLFSDIYNSNFKNNIFLIDGCVSSNSANNTFYNNIFSGSNVSCIPGTEINDLKGISTTSIFVNQSGIEYDYHQNYHLKTTCPGHNYGTDGTDVGVYGTATPWKEGGVPYNPHIQFQSIATQTDGNGNLSVNIKVAAQKN